MNTQDKLKNLAQSIPTSPYSWKITSSRKKTELIKDLLDNQDWILQLELDSLIEGEFYTLRDANDKETLAALRVIREVLMNKVYKLKNSS